MDNLLFIYQRKNYGTKITDELNKIKPTIDFINELETNTSFF